MKIFISYSKEDKIEAEKIFNRLNSNPMLQPWIDSNNLLPGTDWEIEILSNIQSAKAVLLLISKNSIDKVGYVQKEFKESIERFSHFPPNEIYLIPVRLDSSEPRYYELKKLQWVNLFDNWENGIKLIEKVLLKDESDKKNVSIPLKSYIEVLNSNDLFIQSLYENSSVIIENSNTNQEDNKIGFRIYKGEKASALAYQYKDRIYQVHKNSLNNVTTLNAEQTFYFWTLVEERFKIILINGISGSGKSYLTSNYILSQIKKRRCFVVGNNSTSNKIISHLKSDLDFKTKENLENIQAFNNYSELSHINISNTLIIYCLEENLTYSDIKDLLLLIRDDSKFVLIYDNKYKENHDWLQMIYGRLYQEDYFAYITLDKIQRGKFATRLNEIL